MELHTIDEVCDIAYRVRCGAAMALAVQDALSSQSLDLDNYAMALFGAHEYLCAQADKLLAAMDRATPSEDG